VSIPASTKSVISSAQTLLLGIGHNVNQMRLERLPVLPVLKQFARDIGNTR
jgi:hypothetical protein